MSFLLVAASFGWLALTGCRAGPAPGGGQSLPDNVMVKPGEDPETLSEWTKATRKLKYNMQKAVGLEPNEPIAREHFGKGQKLFQERKYDDAADEFKSAAKRWPDSPLEEDALYMQAESEFFADRYSAASDTYGRLLKKFENSRFLEKAVARQFAIARYWDDLDRAKHRFILIPNLTDKMQPLFDTQGNAIKAYESVHLSDPTGPLADDSVMAIANVHFLAGRYDDADYYYDQLRKQYPQSEHQQLAAQLGLRAKMRTYQGPEYDAKPIDQAEDLVQQINVQFPNQPPDERERLRNAGRALRTQRAQRDWETAEYYARTRHYGGARYYYNVILQDHPDSPFAEMARQRLEQYKNLPDNPPQRFKWLVRIFRWNRDDY
jgi:outer membrane protein assembly factor BamD (BamD/ComL family)